MHSRAVKLQGEWDKSSTTGTPVRDVLIETRKLLEAEKLKSTYPVLSLYCDWSVHPAIDKNPLAREMLDLLNQQIVAAMTGNPQPQADSPHDHLVRAFAGIGPRALRRDWGDFHKRFNIKDGVLDSERDWRQLYGQVLQLIGSEPLTLGLTFENGAPKADIPKNLALYNTMLTRSGGDPRQVPLSIEVRRGTDLGITEQLKQAAQSSDSAIATTAQLLLHNPCWCVVFADTDARMPIVIIPDEPSSAFARP